MYQKLLIVGNLGHDPELRYTPNEKEVCSFNVATNRKWTGSDGQKQEETIWFRVSTWGRLAKLCNQYLTKGSQVMCEGRLKTGPKVWTDQAGRPRASYEMTAREVEFLDGGRQRNGQPETLHNDPVQTGINAEEIPF